MIRRAAGIAALALAAVACGRARETGDVPRNLLLVTIDTLRADHVGAYGYTRARTPGIDALARSGAVFEHAYAAAPITLPSHATLLTGRYPPGHGSRDNGMRVSASVPTLASVLRDRGFRTAAFVAAFPLDHQFGLDRGFEVYSDRLGRDRSGRPANERPASQVVDEAIAWLHGAAGSQSTAAESRFFVWVHMFEPHAPYEGDLRRPVLDRYDDEIATADAQLGRLVDALRGDAGRTLVVVAGDHGEAFGEHGEFAHSIFVYDTTLRVPLVAAGPGVKATRVPEPVTLADVAPTAAKRLGFEMKDVDGLDLSDALAGAAVRARELYAESFAPLVEFGWSPLRSIRSGPWKYIAAPAAELYDVAQDAGETRNVESAQPSESRALNARVERYSGATLGATTGVGGEAAERLRALGYSSSAGHGAQSEARADPKDRRELAARLAQVTSGELTGAALVSALEGIVREDPRNGQAHLRLGYARLLSGDCERAEPELHAAAAAGLQSADIYLGLAQCLGARRDLAGAERALAEAKRLEPGNATVVANLGILKRERGDLAGAVEDLNAALKADPSLDEARFNLAITYARAGRRADAQAAARELLARLPQNAPQRAEVERLLRALQ